MIAVKCKGTIYGSGIDYYKYVRDIPEKQKNEIKENTNPEKIFYLKLKKKSPHYTQTGYKVIIYNRDRYEFYHREPNINQLVSILRKEKLVK